MFTRWQVEMSRQRENWGAIYPLDTACTFKTVVPGQRSMRDCELQLFSLIVLNGRRDVGALQMSIEDMHAPQPKRASRKFISTVH